MPVLGTGISITFSSGVLAEITNVDESGIERAVIRTSHAQSTEQDYLPGNLPDYGQLDCEIAFDPSLKPPIDQPAEVVTITYPDGSTWARNGFMSGFRYTAPTGPDEDRMMATATIKFSGDLTVTPPPP